VTSKPVPPPVNEAAGSVIGRRSVLAGVAALAGVVVGAGGAELAGGGRGASVGPNVASPGEALMTEHGVLKRILLAYRAIVADLEKPAGGKNTVGVIADSVQIVSDYIEGFHEGLEEAYVFPRVASEQASLVRTLLVQHDRGRHITARVAAAAGGDLTRQSVRSIVAAELSAFVRMYEPHEAWEDTVIYPVLRRLSTQKELDLLAERFADLETTQYGDNALRQMLDRIGGIEEQLGIADLAAFTPAAPGPA